MVLSTNDSLYRQCTLTVMDNLGDPDITFDSKGVCNYYYEYQAAAKSVLTGNEGEKKIEQLAEIIKAKGLGKKYDCIIGLSGGVDSTYVAYLVKKMGLRPLAVHLDNSWNSELAVQNIENIIKKLDIDLYTLVVNWQEFRDIQLSYIRASVVDIEVVSDHAILATMYKLAHQHNISYIISGTNIVTEFIMPPSWIYKKMDYANLEDIHGQYGKVKLKTYPTLSFMKHLYYSAVLKLSPVSLLDYVPYNKAEIKEFIASELNWRDYGGKHHESLFTKFYQAHILPHKFKIDKRKAHLSTLICSGQITKEQALSELAQPLYNEADLKRDTEYILKKLGLSKEEFTVIMNEKPRLHSEFKSDTTQRNRYMTLLKKTQQVRHLLRKK